MIAILKRELKAYFTSMQAYIYLALFVCVTGVFFSLICINYGYNDFAANVLSNFYYMIFIYAIAIPILTMRMFAEEKKQKTETLLLTAPVSPWEIVLGKFLACFAIFLIGLLIVSVFPVIIAVNGNLPIANTISGYVGIILFSGCMIAVGTLISGLTEEPVIAVIVSAVFGLFTLFINVIVAILPNGVIATFVFFGIVILGIAVLFYLDTKKLWISAVVVIAGAVVTVGLYFWKTNWFQYGLTNSLNWLSIEKRFEEFINGAINLSSVVYLLSVTAICLFVTTRVIASRRWR
ncbi:MAG: ABC transporter permease [Lachnospiraceae bacterium]|nr:ABC transporter permease [Lachnospiraceae bacterium]